MYRRLVKQWGLAEIAIIDLEICISKAAKLFCKTSAADLLNDRVVPFYEAQDIPLLRILTDRGSEYCGNREQHEYQLYLDLEDIEHARTKVKHPQTNGICERSHRKNLAWIE